MIEESIENRSEGGCVRRVQGCCVGIGICLLGLSVAYQETLNAHSMAQKSTIGRFLQIPDFAARRLNSNALILTRTHLPCHSYSLL